MDDLETLVRKMRQAQRKYFRTRDRKVLEESKELEQTVDKRLDELERGPELFDQSDRSGT